MAKKDKASKKADKADPKEEKAAEREFKYGVEDLAEKLDIKPASVRVQLRNKGIDKAGKSYGWNSKAELDEVVAQLKAKDEADEKPAKGAKKDKKAAAAEEPAKGKKNKKNKKSDD